MIDRGRDSWNDVSDVMSTLLPVDTYYRTRVFRHQRKLTVVSNIQEGR